MFGQPLRCGGGAQAQRPQHVPPRQVISSATEAMRLHKEAPKHWRLGSVSEAGLSGWTAYPIMFDGYGFLQCISLFIHQGEDSPSDGVSGR